MSNLSIFQRQGIYQIIAVYTHSSRRIESRPEREKPQNHQPELLLGATKLQQQQWAEQRRRVNWPESGQLTAKLPYRIALLFRPRGLDSAGSAPLGTELSKAVQIDGKCPATRMQHISIPFEFDLIRILIPTCCRRPPASSPMTLPAPPFAGQLAHWDPKWPLRPRPCATSRPMAAVAIFEKGRLPARETESAQPPPPSAVGELHEFSSLVEGSTAAGRWGRCSPLAPGEKLKNRAPWVHRCRFLCGGVATGQKKCLAKIFKCCQSRALTSRPLLALLAWALELQSVTWGILKLTT